MGMFRKTRLRLVALNTGILLITLIILGCTVYFYTEYRLFSNLDHDLRESASHEQKEPLKEEVQKTTLDDRETSLRVVYLLWDSKQNLIRQTPQQTFYSSELDVFKKTSQTNTFQTLKIDQHAYRVLTVPFTKTASKEGVGVTGNLQVIQNIDSEVRMLENLLIVLLVGGGLGVGISLFAGNFLAQRALVPIRKSWEAQQRFVADASHELRTPLSVLQANLELLFRHPTQTIEDESLTINIALQEVKRMNKLVAELLTLARSGSTEPEFSFKSFSFNQMLENITDQFTQLAQSKKLTLHTEIEKDLTVVGDEDRLRQLLIILLDNAFKYNAPAGQIIVTCRKLKQHLEVVVEDQGIGISEEDLPHIFERFYRSDKSRTRSTSGAGLGLSIAQWIVEGHSGSIRAESKLSQGTTFILQIPLKQKVHEVIRGTH